MSHLFTQFVSHTLRPLLLRLLRWTERSGPLSAPRSSLFLHREIHVPVWAVGGAVWAMLSTVLFLEIGPGWPQAAAVLILSTALIALFGLYLRFDHPELASLFRFQLYPCFGHSLSQSLPHLPWRCSLKKVRLGL